MSEEVWRYARELLEKKTAERDKLMDEIGPKSYEVDKLDERLEELNKEIEELEEMIPL